MSQLARSIVSLCFAVTLAACTSNASSDDGGPCVDGTTRCDDGQVMTCMDGAFGAAANCSLIQVCKSTACEDASANQMQQVSALDEFTDNLRDYTGYSVALDFETLRSDAHRILFLGDESDYALAKAIEHVFRGVPQGHMATGYGASDFSSCESPTTTIPLLGISWYGVCARAAGDASIITYAAGDNPMGLEAGDRVVSVVRNGETWQSPGFLDRIGQEPLCDTGLPSTSSRADYAASNLFAVLDAGAMLQVTAPDGSSRMVTTPARGATSISCYDPFDRPTQTKAFTTAQRTDGIVVITLPTFGATSDHPFPSNFTLATYRDWIAESIANLNTALAQYTNITGILFDVRGNSGGSQEYAIDLVAPSLLGPTAGALANCYARIPASSPPMFATNQAEYPFPYQVFIDNPLPKLSFIGKLAVVTDGLAISAGDWISYSAKKTGVPVVGHASAGAYGYTTGGSFVNKSIPAVTGVHETIISYISGAECVDASGTPIEGDAPVDEMVDFAPGDLSEGIDTQLEAAAKLLLQ